MENARLRSIANECRRCIVRHPARGFANGDLANWLSSYRELTADERVWVQVMLIKMRDLAVVVGGYGAAQFYRRDAAPEGAFNIDDVKRPAAGELIERAADLG